MQKKWQIESNFFPHLINKRIFFPFWKKNLILANLYNYDVTCWTNHLGFRIFSIRKLVFQFLCFRYERNSNGQIIVLNENFSLPSAAYLGEHLFVNSFFLCCYKSQCVSLQTNYIQLRFFFWFLIMIINVDDRIAFLCRRMEGGLLFFYFIFGECETLSGFRLRFLDVSSIKCNYEATTEKWNRLCVCLSVSVAFIIR